MNDNISINDRILLTGSGFTRNLGGFLAQEMWVRLFNNPRIQGDDALRKLLLNESGCDLKVFVNSGYMFDYEIAYQQALNKNGVDWNRRKKILSDALFDVYRDMDKSIIGHTSNKIWKDAWINHFISCFAGAEGKKGFIFTVNQDLLIERLYAPFQNKKGLFFYYLGFENSEMNDGLQPDKFLATPGRKRVSAELTEAQKNEYMKKSNSFYIKLHGSFDWVDESGEYVVITGVKKEEGIRQYPLLEWYLELFRNTLAKTQCSKLFIAGYGFGDRHVNEIIYKACRKRNFRVYIMDSRPIGEMREHIERQYARMNSDTNAREFTQCLFNALGGYFTGNLGPLFNGKENKEGQTLMKKEIETFFSSNN